MKTLLLIFTALTLAACAKPGQIQNAQDSVVPTPTPAPVAADVCEVYDSCTYDHNGFSSTPRYNCTVTTYKASEHPEIDISYFGGHDCLETHEDYSTQQSFCGPQHFPCQIFGQGPGPKAIPALGL